MDLTFFEDTPFYSTNSLQGETNSEGNFWHFSSEILNSTTSEIPNSFTSPNVPFLEPNPSHSQNLSFPRVENFDVVDESNKQGGNLDVENNQDENKVPNLVSRNRNPIY